MRFMSVIYRDASKGRQMMKQTTLQRSIAMDRNRKADIAARLAVDMMAAIDPQKSPSVSLKQFCKLPARE